jgi:hypothetical protein
MQNAARDQRRRASASRISVTIASMFFPSRMARAVSRSATSRWSASSISSRRRHRRAGAFSHRAITPRPVTHAPTFPTRCRRSSQTMALPAVAGQPSRPPCSGRSSAPGRGNTPEPKRPSRACAVGRRLDSSRKRSAGEGQRDEGHHRPSGLGRQRPGADFAGAFGASTLGSSIVSASSVKGGWAIARAGATPRRAPLRRPFRSRLSRRRCGSVRPVSWLRACRAGATSPAIPVLSPEIDFQVLSVFAIDSRSTCSAAM